MASPPTASPTVVAALRERLPAMLQLLEALVLAESPTADVNAVGRCAAVLATACQRLFGAEADTLDRDGRPHLRIRWGEPRVLVLGHFDTVWPLGTAAVRPFAVHKGVATGPGVFDMKAGIVQGLFALAALPELDGVELLLTSDEEIGSPTSRATVEDAARHAAAVLVLEPSANGALKVARKGNAVYQLKIDGRAAHAGLEPERGVNALVELAARVLDVAALADPTAETTVTPGVAAAGTTPNTVPERADFTVDVRAWSMAELDRVDRGIRALVPGLRGAALSVDGGINHPPLDEAASRDLFVRAARLARELRLPPLRGAAVGGGSDGNLTAALGVPTLDGLGAVGANAHAEDERVEIDRMPERAALLAALVAELSGAAPGDVA